MSEALWASLVSVGCLVRRLPLFLCAAPQTPLRVFGIIAFDVLHVLRHSRPMPGEKIAGVAMFLDYAGYTNATWDQKRLCETDRLAVRHRLNSAGYSRCIEAYLARLRNLEGTRPGMGGAHRRFDDVRKYREDVAWLALTTAAGIALDREARDADVDTLFRILMLCQIVDDVLDYREDALAGLPSFLTASVSVPVALELTDGAARGYASGDGATSEGAVFPLRVALWIFATMTHLVVLVAGRRYRDTRLVAHR